LRSGGLLDSVRWSPELLHFSMIARIMIALEGEDALRI
jgi:hypothetical protein